MESRPGPGIIKSKSFASPGQFECSVEESAGRKMQMLSFFSNNNNKENTQSRAKAKTRASVADIKDDIEMGEDDLVDIDAEFESLLTKTFEKESRKMSGGEKVSSSASGQVSKRSSGGVGGRGISLDMTGRGMSLEKGPHHSRLQKSQS